MTTGMLAHGQARSTQRLANAVCHACHGCLFNYPVSTTSKTVVQVTRQQLLLCVGCKSQACHDFMSPTIKHPSLVVLHICFSEARAQASNLPLRA